MTLPAGRRHEPSATLRPRYGVLGPLMIWRGQQAIEVPAARHRMVLSVLLANVNRVVSVESLVDELWADAPPGTARKTVQGYIWRLRRRVGTPPDELTTVGPGYQLAVSADRLDALEFERLTESARRLLSGGRRHEAVEVLSTGLRLWRGSAFDSVPDTLTVRAFATRLDEARLTAQELLAATKCSLGSCGEVVPGLTGLAAAHPYRESLHRLLMSALYQAGRPLEALDVFVRFRTRLSAEYGVDPHPDTCRLYQGILRGAADFAPLPEHREVSGAR